MVHLIVKLSIHVVMLETHRRCVSADSGGAQLHITTTTPATTKHWVCSGYSSTPYHWCRNHAATATSTANRPWLQPGCSPMQNLGGRACVLPHTLS